MNEKYVNVDDIIEFCNNYSAYLQGKGQGVTQAALRRIKEFAKENIADVQPLNVVAEHIKNRLYETALNTNGVESDTIAAIAERIDFWISELK